MRNRLAAVAATFVLAVGPIHVAHAQLPPLPMRKTSRLPTKELRSRLPCRKWRQGSSFTPEPWRS